MKRTMFVISFLMTILSLSLHGIDEIKWTHQIQARERNGILSDAEATAVMNKYRATLARHVFPAFRHDRHFLLQIARSQKIAEKSEALEYMSWVIQNVRSSEGNMSTDNVRLKNRDTQTLLEQLLQWSPETAEDYYGFASTANQGVVVSNGSN